MENEKKIKKVYFTLTGTKYHYGMDFLEKGMKLYLEKEPDNKYDKEAIMVKKEGLGRCPSPHPWQGRSFHCSSRCR